MASNEKARVNKLNEDARFFGGPDAPQLDIYDVRAIINFYDRKCLDPDCPTPNEPATSPDHVIPLALGGENKLENLQLLHVNCNKRKGDKVMDFRQGKVCTPDYKAQFVPEIAENKGTYKKHDWAKLENEYITTNQSQRELALKYDIDPAIIGRFASANNWTEKRQQFISETSAKVTEIVSRTRAEQQVAALDVLDVIISLGLQEMASGKAKVTPTATIDALKFREVKGGGIDSRREDIVKSWQDVARDLGVKPEDVIAEFNRTAAGYERGDDSDSRASGFEEQEAGAGWTD